MVVSCGGDNDELLGSADAGLPRNVTAATNPMHPITNQLLRIVRLGLVVV